MCVLALDTVAAEARLCPILAQLTLVHGALYEGLRLVAHAFKHVLRLIWLDWREHNLRRLALRHKSRRLHIHALERIYLGRHGLLL